MYCTIVVFKGLITSVMLIIQINREIRTKNIPNYRLINIKSYKFFLFADDIVFLAESADVMGTCSFAFTSLAEQYRPELNV